MIYYDTETCGLHGPTVLIQYAEDDGEIILHEVFRSPIDETLDLIERFMESELCGFNLAFDHFHLCQTYTTLRLLKLQYDLLGDEWPEDYIDEYALCEKDARFGPCLKPKDALDLMLHARKGPYQSTMNRADIRLKRVPAQLSYMLVDELNSRIKFKDVYFERYKDKTKRWSVQDIKDDLDQVIPDFKDVILKFAPSSALKALAKDALQVDVDSVLLFADVEPPIKSRPEELGYAPFALAVGDPSDWKGAWPDIGKIKVHISHWGFNKLARDYASDDVKYTRQLHYYFSNLQNGDSEEIARERALLLQSSSLLLPGDDDSVLACCVAACRWRGYRVDTDKLRALRSKAVSKLEQSKYNFNSPDVCKRYLRQVMSDVEAMVLNVNGKMTTKGVILEEIAKWTMGEVCDDCGGMGCKDCDDGIVQSDKRHLAAYRASEILEHRRCLKEIELYDKILTVDRFHASFKVIGTLSSRMAGSDGLNPQGIKKDKLVRAAFLLHEDDENLNGGDFSSFEVTLMDASYGDPVLHAELLEGKKIHAIAGTMFFPGKTYEDILATDGLPNELNLYGRSKNGVFALFYGGEEYTLQTRVGIPEEVGREAFKKWVTKYKVWGEERKKIFNMFCSMRQPNGIGTVVEWHEPEDYIESPLGFRRYFTLENRIVKELFKLAESPPEHWLDLKIKVVRRDREQTIANACRSALLAAAFAIQAANMRAAANHVIQSMGATLTKNLQRRIWDVQPFGINSWYVQPMNIHDELMCPSKPELSGRIKGIVDDFIEYYKPTVPLLGIVWKDDLQSWADK